MRILVLGGTRFVGRHLVAAALARGHDVTLLHRGHSGPGLFPEATHVLADRDENLGALDAGTWDATVDVSAYLPHQVRALADALGGRGGRYALVSTVSVYDDPPRPGATEDAPLVELADPEVREVTGETYGGLKVRCEREAGRAFGPGVLVVRPTYVVGPLDYTYRFPYWVARIARGGEVLAPGPPAAPVQVVDGRDLGRWTVALLEGGASGAFSAAAPAPPYGFGQLLAEVVDAVGPPGTALTWVEPQLLREAGEDGRSLPLWSEGRPAWSLALDPARAIAAGLAPRPVAESARDTLAWLRDRPAGEPLGTGITAQREAELLTAWRRR